MFIVDTPSDIRWHVVSDTELTSILWSEWSQFDRLSNCFSAQKYRASDFWEGNLNLDEWIFVQYFAAPKKML